MKVGENWGKLNKIGKVVKIGKVAKIGKIEKRLLSNAYQSIPMFFFVVFVAVTNREVSPHSIITDPLA